MLGSIGFWAGIWDLSFRACVSGGLGFRVYLVYPQPSRRLGVSSEGCLPRANMRQHPKSHSHSALHTFAACMCCCPIGGIPGVTGACTKAVKIPFHTHRATEKVSRAVSMTVTAGC